MLARPPNREKWLDTQTHEQISNIGLPTLLERFVSEKITLDLIETLSDQELIRIGVTTIGDRIRLREEAKKKLQAGSQLQNSSTARLFPGFRNIRNSSGRTSASRKKNDGGSWTAQFFCLSSQDQVKTPNSTEKEILNKSGLGLKKIKLSNLLSEEEVVKVLQEESGFPKLKDSGGFEMLRTVQNGRNLLGVPSPWSSKTLKINVGPQARIYLRPIQHCLSVDPIVNIEKPAVFITCEICNVGYSIHELRTHIVSCGLKGDTAFESLDAEKSTRKGDFGTSEPEYYIYVQDSSNSVAQISNDRNANEISFQDIVNNVELLDHDANSLPALEIPIIPTISTESDMKVLESLVLPDLELPKTMNDIVQECIQFCQKNKISNPVEILRKIQEEVVIGRPLEVEDSDTSIEGETTFITIDRDRILQTSMEEINSIPEEELRKTLEVQFYNELASDYGGPRKEFFRLVLIEIKEKYFDNGIRELLAPDYRTVGITLHVALSILQNGKMPVFLSPDIFDDVESSSIALKNLQEGMNVLGIFDLFKGLPELKFLLQPSNIITTMKKLTTLLRPKFSEEGSNAYSYEKEVYSVFIKYLREVAAGRRGNLSLSSILVFVCSVDEEPLLGFKIHPAIGFCEAVYGYIPTASTCINKLTLPRATPTNKLPGQEELYKLYDYAFSNTFYGLQ